MHKHNGRGWVECTPGSLSIGENVYRRYGFQMHIETNVLSIYNPDAGICLE